MLSTTQENLKLKNYAPPSNTSHQKPKLPKHQKKSKLLESTNTNLPGLSTEYHHGTNQEATPDTQLKLHWPLEYQLQSDHHWKVTKHSAFFMDYNFYTNFKVSSVAFDGIVTTIAVKTIKFILQDPFLF